MEYQSLKKSLLGFKRDLTRYPLRTFTIILILIVLYLLSIAVPGYINSLFPPAQVRNAGYVAAPSPILNTSSTSLSANGGITTVYLKENGKTLRGEPYSAEGSYPVFGIKKLDEKISEVINAHVTIAKYGDADPQGNFSSDFEKPFVSEKSISVELKLSHWSNDPLFNQGRAIETVVGINYDRTHDAIYTFEDLPRLTGLSLNKIAQKISAELTEENGNVKISLEPTMENLSNFIINEKDVVFIYQRYQILGGAAGTPKISIPRVSD